MVMGKSYKSWVIAALQSFVSICLLTWMFYTIDFAYILQVAVQTNVMAILTCVALIAILVIPVSARWRWIIVNCDKKINKKLSFGNSIRINSVNVALNQFLPSTLGGDLYRVLLINSMGLTLLKSIAATFADRLFAFTFLMLIGGPALLLTLNKLQKLEMLIQASILLFCIGLPICIFLFWLNLKKAKIYRKFEWYFLFFKRWIFKADFFFYVAFTSSIVHLITLAVMIIIANMMGVKLELISIAGIMGASLLASRLPISVAGWGVREGVLLTLLGLFGVAPEIAISTSIIYGLTELSAAILVLSITLIWSLFIRFFPKQLRSAAR